MSVTFSLARSPQPALVLCEPQECRFLLFRRFSDSHLLPAWGCAPCLSYISVPYPVPTRPPGLGGSDRELLGPDQVTWDTDFLVLRLSFHSAATALFWAHMRPGLAALSRLLTQEASLSCPLPFCQGTFLYATLHLRLGKGLCPPNPSFGYGRGFGSSGGV